MTFLLRSHYAFIKDCLDAHILAATMEHFSPTNLDDNPTINLPVHHMSSMTPQQRYDCTRKEASRFIHEVVCASLVRDTYDAYQHCDGNKIFRNAKFDILLDFEMGYTKYCLWLWRMLAYENAILSPRQAFEYKWNISSNLPGGSCQHIPNDTVVEIQVHNMKSLLRSQGANVTFQSAQLACESVQIVDDIRDNLVKQSKVGKSSRKQPEAKTDSDINKMVIELQQSKLFSFCPGRQLDPFTRFKEPIDTVNYIKYHKWVGDEKNRAACELV
ncbi:uncharacterized protein LOC144361809 [Saccoglossus kowalevskii]